jgi:hypothetical protein
MVEFEQQFSKIIIQISQKPKFFISVNHIFLLLLLLYRYPRLTLSFIVRHCNLSFTQNKDYHTILLKLQLFKSSNFKD